MRLLAAWLAVLLCLGMRPAAAQIADPGFGDPVTLSGDAVRLSAPPGYGTSLMPAPYGPVAPQQPMPAARPQSWPGGPAPNSPPAGPGGYRTADNRPLGPPAAAVGMAPAQPGKAVSDPPYDPADIVAIVGSERIQACEVLPMINKELFAAAKKDPNFSKMPQEDQEREIHRYQKEYMQQALKELIKSKLLVSELRGHAPKEALEKNSQRIRDFFNNTYLKHLQTQFGAKSVIDLERILHEYGGSLDSQRTLFVEQQLAQGWLGQAVNKEDKEPTREEMLSYFQKHKGEWDTPARVRWEQLTAKFENFPNKPETRAALARWGDDVMLRGVPFADVAKAHSQEFAADEGGVHEWASQGSLRSQIIDQALFALPVGRLSQIIEDEEGLHIVRVLERQDAKQASFTDAQPDIKQRLHNGGQEKRRNDYVERLRERTPVWTIFDEGPSAAVPAVPSATTLR